MPLTSLLPCILAAIVASVAAMMTGIAMDLHLLSWLGAVLFGAALVATAIDVNRPWWGGDAAADLDAPVYAAIRNARLMMIGYLWGAVALFCVYRLSGLRWQHGLQYGAGMALIAWLILLYVHLLAQPGSKLRTSRALGQALLLSLGHGVGALVGVLFLLASGKIASIKDDWAANQVFLVGGLAVAALSAISAYTHIRLVRQQREGVQGTVRV